MTKDVTYIVVKCGNATEHHAAKELDDVIKKHGFAWFGKYGAKIKHDHIKLNNPQKEYVLCLSLFMDGRFNLFFYTIEAFGSNETPLAGTFPKYYQQKQSFINTWIKVKPFSGRIPDLEQLVVRSSFNRLAEVLKKSSVGHFVCKSSI